MMKIIIVRHGQTIDNEKGLFQGHNPGILTEKGREQTKELALKLKDEKINAIYSSDLKRVLDTTEEIRKYHKDIPFHIVKELREIDCGSLGGTKYHEDFDWFKDLPDDAESMEQLGERASRFVKEVYKKYPNSTVLFVGSGKINKALHSVILKKDIEYVNTLPPSTNCEIKEFEYNG